jgi:hypothetical protein
VAQPEADGGDEAEELNWEAEGRVEERQVDEPRRSAAAARRRCSAALQDRRETAER